MKSILSHQKPDDYGEQFQNHLLEIYKLYVDMADKISSRRQSANSFFLSVNTAIIAVIGYVQLGIKKNVSTDFYWLISLAGIAICYTWYRLIKSYRGLNSGKFSVIHNIEQQLPIAPFDAEWEALGKGKDPKKYLPFTKVEMVVPWIFLILHVVVFLKAIPWSYIKSTICSS